MTIFKMQLEIERCLRKSCVSSQGSEINLQSDDQPSDVLDLAFAAVTFGLVGREEMRTVAVELIDLWDAHNLSIDRLIDLACDDDLPIEAQTKILQDEIRSLAAEPKSHYELGHVLVTYFCRLVTTDRMDAYIAAKNIWEYVVIKEIERNEFFEYYQLGGFASIYEELEDSDDRESVYKSIVGCCHEILNK